MDAEREQRHDVWKGKFHKNTKRKKEIAPSASDKKLRNSELLVTSSERPETKNMMKIKY